MGVDYSARFGIGFEVEPSECHKFLDDDFLHEGETMDDVNDGEIMECIMLPDGLEASYWGNSYSGNHTYFICASSHATSKEEMMAQWDLLEAFSKEHFDGRGVSLIGGGLVW
jgi:hypothetical protein